MYWHSRSTEALTAGEENLRHTKKHSCLTAREEDSQLTEARPCHYTTGNRKMQSRGIAKKGQDKEVQRL